MPFWAAPTHSGGGDDDLDDNFGDGGIGGLQRCQMRKKQWVVTGTSAGSSMVTCRWGMAIIKGIR